MSAKILSKLTPYKHIIWDWNGTILNDVDIVIEVVRELLAEYKLPDITPEHYKNIVGFPIEKFYQQIGLKTDKKSFDILNEKFFKAYDTKLNKASPFQGITELLKTLNNNNIMSSILSASEHYFLVEKVNLYGLTPYFQNVYGLSDYYAKCKVNRGKELLTKISEDKKNILMIGDTDHDLEVGHSLGIDVLLIADGHQSIDRLQSKHHNTLSSRYVA